MRGDFQGLVKYDVPKRTYLKKVSFFGRRERTGLILIEFDTDIFNSFAYGKYIKDVPIDFLLSKIIDNHYGFSLIEIRISSLKSNASLFERCQATSVHIFDISKKQELIEKYKMERELQ